MPPAPANKSTNVTGVLPSMNSFFSAISNLHFEVQIYKIKYNNKEVTLVIYTNLIYHPIKNIHPRSFSLHSFHADKSTKKWANHQIFLVYFNYIVYLCKRKNNEIAVAQFVH